MFDYDQLVSKYNRTDSCKFQVLEKNRHACHSQMNILFPSVTMGRKHEVNRNWHHLVALISHLNVKDLRVQLRPGLQLQHSKAISAQYKQVMFHFFR